jgi:hypothetical protein
MRFQQGRLTGNEVELVRAQTESTYVVDGQAVVVVAHVVDGWLVVTRLFKSEGVVWLCCSPSAKTTTNSSGNRAAGGNYRVIFCGYTWSHVRVTELHSRISSYKAY